MATLGGPKAVAKVCDHKLTGFPAWSIRQSYYLMKIPGWSRKARIGLDTQPALSRAILCNWEYGRFRPIRRYVKLPKVILSFSPLVGE
jgi:hypothetical protein